LKLKGKRFNNILDIQKNLQQVLNDVMIEHFHTLPAMAELLGLLR
jgi:hypothetical protein